MEAFFPRLSSRALATFKSPTPSAINVIRICLSSPFEYVLRISQYAKTNEQQQTSPIDPDFSQRSTKRRHRSNVHISSATLPRVDHHTRDRGPPCPGPDLTIDACIHFSCLGSRKQKQMYCRSARRPFRSERPHGSQLILWIQFETPYPKDSTGQVVRSTGRKGSIWLLVHPPIPSCFRLILTVAHVIRRTSSLLLFPCEVP